jgi:Fe2+ transport system protein FeoA
VTLAHAKTGSRLKVVSRDTGKGLGVHLAGIGIHVGDEVTVVRAAPFHGPLLVEVRSSGARVAVGRGVAEQVTVEPADDAR